jgi:hypothetical protein
MVICGHRSLDALYYVWYPSKEHAEIYKGNKKIDVVAYIMNNRKSFGQKLTEHGE